MLQLGFAVWTVLKNALTVVQIFIMMWEMHKKPQRKIVKWAGKNIFIYVFIYWFIFFHSQSHWCYRAEENNIYICCSANQRVYIFVYKGISPVRVRVCISKYVHMCLFMQVHVFAQYLCCMGILVCILEVQVIVEPWWGLWGDRERDSREARAAVFGINRHYPAVL